MPNSGSVETGIGEGCCGAWWSEQPELGLTKQSTLRLPEASLQTTLRGRCSLLHLQLAPDERNPDKRRLPEWGQEAEQHIALGNACISQALTEILLKSIAS